ncbi:HTH-type transcriptional regulator BsdA [Oceanobacillus oncorhynchi subsp. incaldanensis]|uniref:LysR family transcriptional regulator n=1 Tax=Oceanobacillus aidingensis TaxID=645964 RepID=A0ABV9K380_9BACI|nr:LysR family transcriptional regulator [Oceanobacillus oncorhynchi]MDM8099798.1 LysR family transcriptional regulator [Oceanobacillus oncorhynchi]GIO20437.1 HTH-type transcriptional regulator BsdA [Oceanobacillus oncorhynchi subsp. incaldanensis]
MDMRQLRYFYTIAEEGQITRAAKTLHMAQPPLSQSLKALEKEIGVPLFERSGKKMELTEAGEVLYNKTGYFFKYLEETLTEVKETGEGLKGQLTVGCVKTLFSHVPQRIKSFREKYPNVTFELREGDSYLLAEQLKNRSLDLAIVRLPLDLDLYSSFHLPDENYVVIMPEQWAKSYESPSITMNEIANLPLILLRRISGIGQYELIIDKFKELELAPDVVTVCPDVDMILELVSAEVGASIVPASTLKKHSINGIKSFTIEDETIISKSAIIWLKDRYLTKSKQRFIELFEESLKVEKV